jgi:hypothetical protein
MFKIIMAIVLIVALIAIGPLLTIWSANTLFPLLAIPYTIETWAAVVVMGAFIRANVSVKRKD